jgi:hypothetical protein
MLDRERDVELRERTLERRAPAIDGLAHDSYPLGRGPSAYERSHLAREQLRRPALAGALEEANRSVQRRPRFRLVGEELVLEVGQRRRDQPGRRPGQLVDVPARKLGELSDRTFERGEHRPARLVRDRHRDVGSSSKSLEQRPLRSREILEAVRENGLPRPRLEVAT